MWLQTLHDHHLRLATRDCDSSLGGNTILPKKSSALDFRESVCGVGQRCLSVPENCFAFHLEIGSAWQSANENGQVASLTCSELDEGKSN